MTEDNNEMEVDDILSSIKNILEEDDNQEKNDATEKVTANDTSNSEDEDVLELSDDMRIDGYSSADGGSEVNNIEEASPLDVAIGEIDSMNDVVQQDEPDEIKSTDGATDGININSELNGDSDNVVEMPALQPEVIDMVAEEEPITVVEESGEHIENAAEKEAEPIDDAENAVSLPITEETEQFETDNAEIDVVEEKSENEAAVNEVVAEEEKSDGDTSMVDASANIISNFAKMFAHNNAAEKKEKTIDDAVTEVGDRSKTLEGFVKDAIVKVIGDDIAKMWNNGADYHAMAEAEIKLQISRWLNDNLPIMVEKIVKEEIERVIAKVGS